MPPRKSRMLADQCTSQTETGHFEQMQRNERRTLLVVVLTAVMMIIELAFGYLTGSMALLADGWHMASHAGALFITYLAYVFAKSTTLAKRFSFGTGKFIPLGGYTSAVALAIVAFLMGIESIQRFMAPLPIRFDEAILVTAIGLVVNIVSAFILDPHQDGHSHDYDHAHDQNHEGDHDDHHHEGLETSAPDHNIRSAYYHVLADALTSILALVALFIGKYADAPRVDALMGGIGSIIILRWAYLLCQDTAWELLDGHAKSISQESMIDYLQQHGASVEGMHVWRIGPHITACELVLVSAELKGAEFYKQKLKEKFSLQHIVVEERLKER